MVAGPFTIFGQQVDGYINYNNLRSAQNGSMLVGTADPGTTVTLLVDGNPFAPGVGGSTDNVTTTADASGNWSISFNVVSFELNRSIHTFSVTATDAAGNVSAPSNALTIYNAVYKIPLPTLDTFSNIVNGYINAAQYSTNQTLSGTSYGGYIISVYDYGVLLGTVNTTFTTGEHWSFDLGALSQGAHSLTVKASDYANNISPASKPIKFNVDTICAAPTNLVDTAVVNGYVTAKKDKATQALTGKAEAHSSVAIYNNGALLGTVTANAAGTWRYVLGVLADGTYGLTAQATDKAGNVSAQSAALTFIVDTHAPTPTIDNVTYEAATGLAQLTGTTTPGLAVSIYDITTLIGSATANSAGVWTFSAPITTNGMQRYSVTSIDAAGNIGTAGGQTVFGRAQNTKLVGGVGNDLLIGAAGDTLTGAAGSDTFAFHAGFGKETITDFTATGTGADILQFTKDTFADWAHLLAATKQVGSDLTITLDSSDVITLNNVALASFTSASAHFV